MYKKLTKCPNVTRYLPEKYCFSDFRGQMSPAVRFLRLWSGPALSNRRSCSNFPFTFPPSCESCPSSPFPFLSPPLIPFPLRAAKSGGDKTSYGSGIGGATPKFLGGPKAHVAAGNLRHINIIVVQTGNLIFRVQNCAPLNFAALFGRTPRTCLRPALPMVKIGTYCS